VYTRSGGFCYAGFYRTDRDRIMEIEWTDADPATGEKRFVRARKFAREWSFDIRFKRRTNWEPAPVVTRDMWETLLDALERRYRRREGVSEDDLARVRRVLAALGEEESVEEEKG
jgi:hypothetical protein